MCPFQGAGRRIEGRIGIRGGNIGRVPKREVKSVLQLLEEIKSDDNAIVVFRDQKPPPHLSKRL
jgi:hypothetical protein